MADLFQTEPQQPAAPPPGENAPLADRLRPQRLEEVVGQEHLTGAEGAIGRMVAAGKLASMILWGPPGTGKTTIAHVVSLATRRRFVALSALSAGVKEVRAVIEAARRELGFSGAQTVLFIDEVHRFSKTQQDSLLASSPSWRPPPRTPSSASCRRCCRVPCC